MLLLAVLPEALAVVRGHDHDRPVVDPELFQGVEEAPHDRVGGRHLAVVRGAVLAPEGLRRVVGDVRLVDVKQEEERLAGVRADPGLGERRRLVAGPLVVDRLDPGNRVDRILVEVEEHAQSGLGAQNVRGDGGPGRIAALLEEARKAPMGLAVEGEADVVPDTVLGREHAGQHRRVRRERHGARRVRVLEQPCVLREAVEKRGSNLGVPVQRKAVGAQRVDRDQDDRRIRKRAKGALLRARGQEEREQRRRGQACPTHLRHLPNRGYFAAPSAL